MRLSGVGLLLLVLGGCSLYMERQLDGQFGPSKPVERQISQLNQAPEYHRDIKPIIDGRCVVCHACYDSPCQLNLTSYQGLERGASQDPVYNGGRLLAMEPTRLFIDAQGVEQWRQRGFYPVLNERAQSAEANLLGSSLYRMLALKQQHPLPKQSLLPDDLELGLDRSEQCPSIEEFDLFERLNPLWGMPYGLPQVSEDELGLITRWLEIGAPVKPLPALPEALLQQVDQWERFFNASGLKQQLVARYLYEHLFLAHLYFPTVERPQFFKLVRSYTPSGQPIEPIASRRPTDSPGTPSFYYRLMPVTETLVAKTHMPYRLDPARMQRWQELFLKPDYDVDQLPSYASQEASNPFVTYQQLPVSGRYRFLLDEAQFFISGFIKGPVCRGQTALNVIQDRFWVLFVAPNEVNLYHAGTFYDEHAQLLQMPAEEESQGVPLVRWRAYSKAHRSYLQAKADFIDRLYPQNRDLSFDVIWDGEGVNPNAALTVFRHFDSATVAQGFIGPVPKTAWLIDYGLLERIHYLLVAGFDVYANVGHQLLTRLYMDFLRMEGEANFLGLLPADYAQQQLLDWYQDAEGDIAQHLQFLQRRDDGTHGIKYLSDQPKQEFFERLGRYLGPRVVKADPIHNSRQAGKDPVLMQLQRLTSLQGERLNPLAELTLLRVRGNDDHYRLFTLLKDRSHRNLSSLFGEAFRTVEAEQALTLVEGVLGAYPNTLLDVSEQQLPQLVERLLVLDGDADFRRLLDRYGVRRTSEDFWRFSDGLQQAYLESEPITAGLLDYNRLENR